jgi:hypothetical protein
VNYLASFDHTLQQWIPTRIGVGGEVKYLALNGSDLIVMGAFSSFTINDQESASAGLFKYSLDSHTGDDLSGNCSKGFENIALVGARLFGTSLNNENQLGPKASSLLDLRPRERPVRASKRFRVSEVDLNT